MFLLWFYSNTFISHGGGWQWWRNPNIISPSNVAFAACLKSALDVCSSGVSQRFGQNTSTETLVLLLWLSHPLNASLHSPGMWLQQTVPWLLQSPVSVTVLAGLRWSVTQRCQPSGSRLTSEQQGWLLCSMWPLCSTLSAFLVIPQRLQKTVFILFYSELGTVI